MRYGLRLMAHQLDVDRHAKQMGGIHHLKRLIQQLCQFPSICPDTPDLVSLATQLSVSSIHPSLGALVGVQVSANSFIT